jgi:ribosome-associated protein
VLVSAGNERQLSTVVDEVQRKTADQGRKPRRREGTRETGWMLLDYGDVIVHAFTAEQREYYGLERLWRDAPVVEFTDPAAAAAASGAVAGD